MRCCSRAFFVHLFWALFLPFLRGIGLSLVLPAPDAAKLRPTASRKSSLRLRCSSRALRSSFFTISFGIDTINRAIAFTSPDRTLINEFSSPVNRRHKASKIGATGSVTRRGRM